MTRNDELPRESGVKKTNGSTSSFLMRLLDKFGIPSILIAGIGVIVWVQNTHNSLDTLSGAVHKHHSLPAHPGAEKRITEIETHFQYIREDLKWIKEHLRKDDR